MTGSLFIKCSWLHKDQCHAAQEVRDTEGYGRAESDRGMKYARTKRCVQVRIAS
jgi:hypothetical protein